VSSFEAVSIGQSTVAEIRVASSVRGRRGSHVETLACTMGRSKLMRGASSVAPIRAVLGCLRLAARNVTLDLPPGVWLCSSPSSCGCGPGRITTLAFGYLTCVGADRERWVAAARMQDHCGTRAADWAVLGGRSTLALDLACGRRESIFPSRDELGAALGATAAIHAVSLRSAINEQGSTQ
jgi:hypothetical protein